MNRAVIIGASSGMGLEVSKLLLADGWDIGAAARRMDELEKLKAMSPEHVEIECIDVTADDADRRLTALIARMGGMNLFFLASGIGKQNADLEMESELKTVETNALGFTRMVDIAFHYFSENCGGHIVVISSIAGTKGLGVAPSYSATKAFQNTYVGYAPSVHQIYRHPTGFCRHGAACRRTSISHADEARLRGT